MVSLSPEFTVVGEAESAEEGLDLVQELGAELVLMDINMPGVGGIEGTRRIKAAVPEVVVVLMSTYREEDLPADARTCGADVYVHKEELEPDVLRDVWDGRGSAE